jgi:hypothetical protein
LNAFLVDLAVRLVKPNARHVPLAIIKTTQVPLNVLLAARVLSSRTQHKKIVRCVRPANIMATALQPCIVTIVLLGLTLLERVPKNVLRALLATILQALEQSFVTRVKLEVTPTLKKRLVVTHVRLALL